MLGIFVLILEGFLQGFLRCWLFFRVIILLFSALGLHFGGLLHQEEVTGLLLLLILLGLVLVDAGTEVRGISAEGNVHQLKEAVHTCD